MSLVWLHRFVQRTHPLVPPGLLLGLLSLIFGVFTLNSVGGIVRMDTTEQQFLGTLVLFILLPSYLLAMLIYAWRGTETALVQLEPLIPQDNVTCINALARVDIGLKRLRPISWLYIGLGVSLGIYQSSRYTVTHFFETGLLNLMDAGYVLGNMVVLMFAVMWVCWRLPVSIAFLKLGRELNIDLYRLDRAQALTRMATTDFLTAAGGMAFMALQSLDAEFRLQNYVAGIAIGLPAGLVLMGLPVWGLHEKIVLLKRQRLAALYSQIEEIMSATNSDSATDEDIVRLEAVTAHTARIRSMTSWPINLRLITRIFAYGVIPPLAWVGAALVENVVDSW